MDQALLVYRIRVLRDQLERLSLPVLTLASLELMVSHMTYDWKMTHNGDTHLGLRLQAMELCGS